jgi:hypothetical protein
MTSSRPNLKGVSLATVDRVVMTRRKGRVDLRRFRAEVRATGRIKVGDQTLTINLIAPKWQRNYISTTRKQCGIALTSQKGSERESRKEGAGDFIA